MTRSITRRSQAVALEEHLRARIVHLQSQFLRDVPSAVADLARLRRALNGSAGSNPTVWSVVFDGWPADLSATSDQPSRAESAAHAAVCLYAVHQQGQRVDGMHQPNWSLGRSVGSLAMRLGLDSETAVKRRLDAVLTTDDLREVLHHSRGLITQLRGEKIPLDYALFAKHLYWLQSPVDGDRARLRWARDYYFRPNTSQRANPEGDPS
ncbi:MAG TPA: type I-E CRISPR-associated protein Cse2/CasB [Mycobacterium sp.]